MLSKSEIKHLRSLRLKKFRQKYNQFIVEGEKTISELYTSPYRIVEIFGTMEVKPQNTPIEIPFKTISRKELDQISNHKAPNGMFAVVEIVPESEIQQNKITICLDDIQDPGNLGAIIRIADWYGIEQILCSQHSVDLYNWKTLSATMGSFARVQVNYTDLIPYLKGYDGDILACSMEGRPVYEYPMDKNCIIVIGNEGKGIKEEILKLCTQTISIPRIGQAESLNAAIATAVICDNLVGRQTSLK